nr:MAG TPA: hypothetical protein [Caudoviricetes sp.]
MLLSFSPISTVKTSFRPCRSSQQQHRPPVCSPCCPDVRRNGWHQ